MRTDARLHFLSRFGLALVLAGASALAVLTQGCNETDESALAGSLTSPESTAPGDGTDRGGPRMPELKLSDLPTELALTAEQTTQMEAALAKLNAHRGNHGPNGGGPGGGRGRDGRGRGRGPGGGGPGGHGPGGPGPDGDDDGPFGGANGPMGNPPLVTFLEDTSAFLSADQFAILARFLAERRAGLGIELGGLGEHMGGMALQMMARQLDLSETQRTALRETFRSHAEEARAVMLALRDGTITVEVARDQLKAIREDLRSDTQAILTAEQWEKLESLRLERLRERIGRRIDHLDEAMARRAEGLDRILLLDDGQASQVEAILVGTIPARTTVLEGVAAGTTSPEDAAAQMLEIEKAAADQIRPLLSADQLTRFEALIEFLPRGLR